MHRSCPAAARPLFCRPLRVREQVRSRSINDKTLGRRPRAGTKTCAEEEIRTLTPVTALPPQSSASTSFATSARGCKYRKIFFLGKPNSVEGPTAAAFKQEVAGAQEHAPVGAGGVEHREEALFDED